jgi:hypothetical protein
MPDEYITNERVLSVASQVAEQIGHLHVADVWADFCELIEAQILIGYYPTPTRANG